MDLNKQGIEYMQEGKYEEAAKCFAQAIEENPKEPIYYINFGNLLSAVGDPERAIAFLPKH